MADRINLAYGPTGEPTGYISVERDATGAVVLEIKRHHTITLRLPPTLARRLSEMLAVEAGPSRPKLEVVETKF